ncbi:hypothetical protein JCM10207_005758 [Rhodosporidiobolus poonsookiae]
MSSLSGMMPPPPSAGPAVPVATSIEVDDTQALEYLTLDRKQDFALHEIPRPIRPLPLPTTMYPSLASIAAVAPARPRAEIIISFSLSSLGWLFSVVHAPTFMEEFIAFWARGNEGVVSTSPAWLALYFALLTCGAAMLTAEQRMLLGLSPEDCLTFARTWAPCTSALLYHSDFLERHTLHSLQAICVLIHGGQDIWSTTVITSLRCTGLSIAMEKNLHRLVSNEDWERSSAALSPETRVKALIHRETCKKVFWTLPPSRISTPLPLNLHDRDLTSGLSTSHPDSTYTSISWQRAQIHLSHYVQRVFHAVDEPAEVAHGVLLAVDDEFMHWFASVEPWWTGRDGGMSRDMPLTYKWLQSAFTVSAQFKMLDLHRRYINKPEPRYDASRARIVDLARSILREAPKIGECECRLASVLYHLSSASFLALRDLFNHPSPSAPSHSASSSTDPRRAEVRAALAVLDAAKGTSSIAARAGGFVERLLEMEGVQHGGSGAGTGAGAEEGVGESGSEGAARISPGLSLSSAGEVDWSASARASAAFEDGFGASAAGVGSAGEMVLDPLFPFDLLGMGGEGGRGEAQFGLGDEWGGGGAGMGWL